jgi:peptidoglycan/xylan/chitin deacetylase (PgdA/CDA1 family)
MQRNAWLPKGAVGAVCFSIDDVHPAAPNAGPGPDEGVLDRLRALLERHPRLHATLFVTPDWRPAQLVANRLCGRIPFLSERVYHIGLHPAGLLRLDRHPEFVAQLRSLPRTELAPHGLHHVHRGPLLAVEFQEQPYGECVHAVRRALQIFASAGLETANGFCPPGWSLPLPLLAALEDLEFAFVTAARDVRTPIDAAATNGMSGLRGVSIVRPQLIGRGQIVHLPVNFQATSPRERAFQVVDCGGLLSIKSHAFKHEGGHTMLDGLDDDYCSYLDQLFFDLEQRYGDALWWTSMSEIAAVHAAARAVRSAAF